MKIGGPGTEVSGSRGGGRWEGEGLVVIAEPRESDVPWLPVARKAPHVPSLSTLVVPPLLRGLSQALLSIDLILGDPAHLAAPQATEKQDFINNPGDNTLNIAPPPPPTAAATPRGRVVPRGV